RYPQRIDGRNHMAPDTIVADELVDPVLHRGNFSRTSAKSVVAARARRIEDAARTERCAKTRASIISAKFRQLTEIGPPLGWNGKWVLEIIEIESFNKSEIDSIRQTLRFAHGRSDRHESAFGSYKNPNS